MFRSVLRHGTLFVLACGLVTAGTAFAQEEGRNFDRRTLHNLALKAAAPSAVQKAAEAGLSLRVKNLAVEYDGTTGAARTIVSHTGYLTGANPGADAEELALEFARENLGLLGLTPADLDYEVLDRVESAGSGATHVYLRQVHRGVPVYNGLYQVNVNRDGRILGVANAFVPRLASTVRGLQPRLGPAAAVRGAASHLGIALDEDPETVLPPAANDARQRATLRAPGLSRGDVETGLMLLPVGPGETRLVWNLQVETLDGEHHYDMNVDALTGDTWTRFDWVSSGTYRVFQEPDESPLHGTQARALVVNPEDATASPSGWFTGGTMAGNNVHACPDTNANNVCDSDPQCSGTTCDFPLNLSQAPSSYIPAATANLFYWNNHIHDVQYQYGFDEAAGNFQESNFGKGGAGSDSVNADAQDGSGNCNANFATPPDGSNPRMQMFTCNAASPSRDGDFDNGVIVHEYGHGISNRQVGGPQTTSCLGNLQQAGEGWSDWFALVYTGEPGDAGTDARGVGSYLFNLTPEGGTIRNLPYSTSNAINNWTYSSIGGASIPHGIGSRWAQGIWEVYWALVDKHGFEVDLLNFDLNDPNEAGNKRALFYVNEGLKNTVCSPTFINDRDGIIQAVTDNFGGEDLCEVWTAFAAFGLGTDASTGGPNATTATNGFSVPPGVCGGPSDVVLQFGTVTTDEVVRTVSLNNINSPIVVTGPPSFQGSDPSTIRVQNVTSSGFEQFLQEWDYLDGSHALEDLGFVATSTGAVTLGTLDAEAGSLSLDHNWAPVSFTQTFASAPVVVAQVATNNGSQAVVTRIRNVTSSGFEVRLQEEEGNDGTHAIETVHYVAIETGSTTVAGNTLVVGRTTDSITQAWALVSYSPSVTSPTLVAAMQTFDGSDPATLRYRNLGSSSFEVKVEEETSLDTETNHVTEVVGYIVLGN